MRERRGSDQVYQTRLRSLSRAALSLCTGRELWDPGSLLAGVSVSIAKESENHQGRVDSYSQPGRRQLQRKREYLIHEWFQSSRSAADSRDLAPVGRAMTSAPHLSFDQSDHQIRALIRLHSELKVQSSPVQSVQSPYRGGVREQGFKTLPSVHETALWDWVSARRSRSCIVAPARQ